MIYYSENNVFEAAIKRIEKVYDYHDDVIISMSGGKDSTVLFRIALEIAKKKNRLPIKVFWLDQEAEWQATADYMEKIMKMPEVKPLWFQIPFDFTNSLSPEKNFLKVWDEDKKELWIREKSDISIKENPTQYTRFHDLIKNLPKLYSEGETAVLIGMRATESLNRKMAIMHGKSQWRGETWCSKKDGNIQDFFPIYDFTNDDIWTAIAKNKWEYNKAYDYMYRYGKTKQQLRVSALIHETAWHSIEDLQEIEPKTYNKFCRRIEGTSTFNHAFEQEVIPKNLPFAFSDWKEYRDYLLIKITKPEYHDYFRKLWKGQDDEGWYKEYVKEILLNDIDGTNNSNYKSSRKLKERSGKNNFYDTRAREEYKKWSEQND